MKTILSLIFASLLFIPILNFSYAESETILVDPGYQKWISINLDKGATVSGDFSVQGGSGDDIDFWVENPSGYQIIPERRVHLDYNFNFESEEEGTYRIYFDNSMSTFSNKVIYFSYDIQNPIVPGGGCLIATATYGSELAPQVQKLRELRDNSLLQTESGTSFMAGFNQFYYSFSPTIADWERENPTFKEFVKITLTPMISSLSILNYVDMDSESSVVGYGISLILLNVGMYFVAPVVVIHTIRKKF